MRARAERIEDVGEPMRTGVSWAFSVNETARHDGVEITLLTCTIVDELVRLTGLFQFDGPLDGRLASIPHLDVAGTAGAGLASVSAHVLPHRRMAWVSWLFQRPATVLHEYEARIEVLSVDYSAGRRPPEERVGPWAFRFELPPKPAAARMLAALDE